MAAMAPDCTLAGHIGFQSVALEHLLFLSQAEASVPIVTSQRGSLWMRFLSETEDYRRRSEMEFFFLVWEVEHVTEGVFNKKTL